MFYEIKPAANVAATIVANSKDNAGQHRKEDKFTTAYHAFYIDNEGAPHEVVDMRFYHTEARAYCALWVKASDYANATATHNGSYWSASGLAGGYDYHRGSAAAAEAIENAGIYLPYDIGGHGDSMVEQALAQIAHDICGVADRPIWCVKSYG